MTRLLVANRGEIARRVMHTCRDMGIETVAVFTAADATSPHVTDADMSVGVDSYLDIDQMVQAALRSGAGLVHPGYGFLSEDAPFARAVLDAGLTWIGPPPEAIGAMGSKIAAKRLMAQAGVPVLPSSLDVFPVLVKASAGGGGRGMRIVRAADELDAAVEAARSEAASAFSDPTVFCEPYLESARHIEVQILADRHGRVWTLGERECSIQRRHQKVLEESPSPFVTPRVREALYDAARKAALAVEYVGAGTVEFLVDADASFYFLEMNTRLQVEHPVTECVTGLDLVRLQLRVASGERLGDPPSMAGHAIEVRLYAEDPAHGWLPQSGVLQRFDVPGVTTSFEPLTRPGLRLDAGVVSGSEIGVHYDPMLAKLIAWAPERDEAAQRLADSLARARIHGLRTNRDLLVRVLRDPGFLDGDTTTAFLSERAQDSRIFPDSAVKATLDPRVFPENARIFEDFEGEETRDARIFEPLADQEAVRLSKVAAARAVAASHRASAKVLRAAPSGWRNVRSAPRLNFGVEYEPSPQDTPGLVVLEVDGIRYPFEVAIYADTVEVDSILGPVTVPRDPRFPTPKPELATGSLVAPMPGTVVRVAVAAGDAVREGQVVLWLEAMKMEHQVVAPSAGVVAAINATPGQQVEWGAVLAVIEEQ